MRAAVIPFPGTEFGIGFARNGSQLLLCKGKETIARRENLLKSGLESATELTMDFSGLDYISSAGLRVLLSAHKAMSKKGGMKVTNVNEMVREVFDVTGFSDILDIE